jgi:dihydrofolate reductase
LPLTGHGNQDQRGEGGTAHSSDAIVPARTPEGGFSRGGWTGPHIADHRRVFSETFAASGGFLLGRRTYEIFASYWPTVEDPNSDVVRALNDLPKYVVSSTLEGATRPRTSDHPRRGSRDSAAQRIAGEAAAGGRECAARAVLYGLDLVDEFQLWLHPIVLGNG